MVLFWERRDVPNNVLLNLILDPQSLMIFIGRGMNALCLGRLSAVGSPNITASNSTLSLTWEPPFTLDITNVDPDITGYCVEVVNFTSSLTLLSQCGITETAFTYPIPPDVNCHKYEFTIRPLNIAGMGDTATATFVAVEASK